MARAEAPPSDRKGTLLIGLAVALGLLAIVQWYELASENGTTFCSINETLDCLAVWNSPFAKAIHRFTGLPIAAWGLVYAFAATAAAFRFQRLHRAGKKDAEPIWAVRFVGAVGGFTSLVLLIASVSLGTYCLTCIGTYALAIAYLVIAMRAPSVRPLAQVKPGRIVLVPALYVVLGWIVLLLPASSTPSEPKTHLPPKPDKTDLELYLDSLPGDVRNGVAIAVDAYRKAPELPRKTPRRVVGSESAAVRILDFSDVRCSHCRQLDGVMVELEGTVPAGSYSHESRWFPLDSVCNPEMPKETTDPSGVRCLGPRIMICIEDQPNHEKARHRIFEEQGSLTIDLLYEIASKETGVARADLEKCVASPRVGAAVKEDIEYASAFHLDGTPLVVINGRKASGLPAFLYAFVMAKGDLEHPAFVSLKR